LEEKRAGCDVAGAGPIHAWDKVCIDYGMWSHIKHTAEIYFLTREKFNSAATVSSRNLIDNSDSRNHGFESDCLVSPRYREVLRRITYTDPADGTTYTYLTNEMKIPVHQLVII
jgi:hypothetical protein|tara:strand:+ start:8470 stop:8811 length:342 start_codon:yes stop_codon:yes gene_type:complete